MAASATARFLVDEQGNRTAVLLEMEEYRQLLDAQEELEAVRAFDEAMACNEEVVPLEEAIRRIEGTRQ